MTDFAPAPTTDPQAPTAPAPAPALDSAAPASPAIPASPAPATGAVPDGYVPSYRLRETRDSVMRQAQEEYARKEAEIRAEADRYRTQLQALVGVQPPQNPEIDAVRQQFGQLYPGLTQLEQKAKDLLGLVDRAGDFETQNQHYWQTYGRQTMDRLFERAAGTLGAPLSDTGKRTLHAAFTGFLQSSPELMYRYENDPTIIEDFWRDFSSSFVDPARRNASASVAGRAPAALPQDSPSGAPRPAGQPQQFSGIDDRVSAAWTQYNQNAKPR